MSSRFDSILENLSRDCRHVERDLVVVLTSSYRIAVLLDCDADLDERSEQALRVQYRLDFLVADSYDSYEIAEQLLCFSWVGFLELRPEVSSIPDDVLAVEARERVDLVA